MQNINNIEHWILISTPIIVGIAIWTIAWKGFALWRAAGNKDKGWFIAILILNTLGILEMLYLFAFSKEKVVDENKEIPKAPETKAEDKKEVPIQKEEAKAEVKTEAKVEEKIETPAPAPAPVVEEVKVSEPEIKTETKTEEVPAATATTESQTITN